MAACYDKRKSPVFFFIAAFFVIMAVMLVANYRSALEQELDAPVEGIEKLYTTKDSLVAVSASSEVRIWNWDKIDVKPEIKRFQADTAVWLSADKLAWIPSNNPGKIIVGSWADKQNSEQLTFGSSWQCEHLGISGEGRFVALLLADRASIDESSGNYGHFRVEIFSPAFDKLIPVVTISRKNDVSALYEIDVSGDGAFIAAVGQANDFAWIGVFNVEQRKIVWEKVVETSSEFTDVAFSPNGEVVYAGGEGTSMYAFETISGKQVGQFLMDQEQLAASFNEQRVTCTEVSPDGIVVAAGVNPGNKIYFWDTRTGKRLGVSGGCRGLNNLAFSPDSTTFVVAGRNYGGSLKVSRVPGG